MIQNSFKIVHLSSQKIHVRHGKKKEQCVPLCLRIFFLFIQVICGYKFGFHKLHRRKTKTFIYIASFTFFIIMSTLQIWPAFRLICLTTDISRHVFIADLFWHATKITQFFGSYFILLLTNYTIYDFVLDIYEIRVSVNKSTNRRIESISIVFTLTLFFVNFGTIYLSCVLNWSECFDHSFFYLPLCVFALPELALYATSASQILIFLYVQTFLHDIMTLLKTAKISLLEAEKYYRKLVRCCEKNTPLNDKLIILMLLTATPKLMSSIWYTLTILKTKEFNWVGSLLEDIHTINMLIQICLPSVVVQFVAIRETAFKTVLYDKSMNDKDPMTTAVLNRFLKYMKARNLVNDVWGIVPIDLRLPVSMCCFCVTYIIFLIQITHLFD